MAQFKFTVLLMNNGPLRITSGPFDVETVDSSHSLEDEELKVYYFLLCNGHILESWRLFCIDCI